MKTLDEELQEIREVFEKKMTDGDFFYEEEEHVCQDDRKIYDFFESKIRQLVEEREKEFKIARAREITNLMDKDEYVKNSWCQSYIEDTEYDDSMDRADEYDEMASLVEKLDNEENGFIDPKDLPF